MSSYLAAPTTHPSGAKGDESGDDSALSGLSGLDDLSDISDLSEIAFSDDAVDAVVPPRRHSRQSSLASGGATGARHARGASSGSSLHLAQGGGLNASLESVTGSVSHVSAVVGSRRSRPRNLDELNASFSASRKRSEFYSDVDEDELAVVDSDDDGDDERGHVSPVLSPRPMIEARECSVRGCVLHCDPLYKDYCTMHGRASPERARRKSATAASPASVCIVSGCEFPRAAETRYCRMHGHRESEHEAARSIQKVFKGWAARRSYTDLLELKEMEEEQRRLDEQAAEQLQAIQRSQSEEHVQFMRKVDRFRVDDVARVIQFAMRWKLRTRKRILERTGGSSPLLEPHSANSPLASRSPSPTPQFETSRDTTGVDRMAPTLIAAPAPRMKAPSQLKPLSFSSSGVQARGVAKPKWTRGDEADEDDD